MVGGTETKCEPHAMLLLRIVRCVQLCVLEYVGKISRGKPPTPASPILPLYWRTLDLRNIHGGLTDIYWGGAKSPSFENRKAARTIIL